MLQQVAVVAGDLRHEAARIQSEPLAHLHGVSAGMLHPAVGVGRQISVVREDLRRRDELLELDQKAVVADVRVERIERLHLIQLVRCDVGLTQRRHPKVDKRRDQSVLAKSTMRAMDRALHIIDGGTVLNASGSDG